MTHFLRSCHDAILVGAGTARADNPGLNSRYSENESSPVGLERQPRPLVLDPNGSVGVEHLEKCFDLAERGEGRAPWWIVCGDASGGEKMKQKIKAAGGGVIDAGKYTGKEEGVDWEVVLKGLAGSGVTSVMIEGGGAVCIASYSDRLLKPATKVMIGDQRPATETKP
jgi:2,5-diamino-6-(ribosylamino)-4(3H)-pyrimidinone 5'-phosphate reductase